MKQFVILGYLVVVHAAIVVLAVKPNIATAIHARLGIPDVARVKFNQKVMTERVDPAVPSGSTLFHGDSITQALPASAVASGAVNFGIGSQDTRQLAAMLAKLSSHKVAEKVYLNIGTNDIGPRRSGYSEADTAALVALIPVTVPVVWSSILPRTGHEAEIVAANLSIAKMCSARALCTFVDTHEMLAPSGTGSPLPDIYHDGVHPNAKGYALWMAALKAADVASASLPGS